MSTDVQSWTQKFELADALLAGRDHMLEPQDLPGRYGRVVRAVDHLLQILKCPAVVGGGWAVWRHGFTGRLTQDLDIVLATANVDDFLRAAAVAGFEVLQRPAGRWPKIVHKETGITVDILPEGERPGTPTKPAPTTLPHPSSIGGRGVTLRYISLPPLIELKLAAGRGRDESDVIELVRANAGSIAQIRAHLQSVHADYVAEFDRLVERARAQGDD
jgi:hypothetical protein